MTLPNKTGMGVIPFGSSDPAVLYQDALTSLPANGTEFGTGVSYSDEGLDTNGTGGAYVDLTAAGVDHASLLNAGQMSITVKSQFISDYLGRDNTSSGCTGRQAGTYNEYILSWSPTNGTSAATPWGRLMVASTQSLQSAMDAGTTGAQPLAVRATDWGKGDESVITLSWIGAQVTYYIDDAPHYTFTSGLMASADLFRYIFFGSLRERLGSTEMREAGWPTKNFIISNRPVALATHPMLAKCVTVGDSFSVLFDLDSVGSPANGYDQMPKFQMKGYLAERGLTVGGTTTGFDEGISGYGVNGTVVDDTGTGAGLISSQLTAALADNPSVIFYFGGVNDALKASSFTKAGFDAALKADMNTLLATSETTQKVFIPTIPSLRGEAGSYDALRISQTADVNADIKGLTAWWDAANPTRKGAIVVYDVFTAYGGETSAADSKILGTWWTGYINFGNDVHPSAWGRRITGRMLGQAIYENLS